MQNSDNLKRNAFAQISYILYENQKQNTIKSNEKKSFLCNLFQMWYLCMCHCVTCGWLQKRGRTPKQVRIEIEVRGSNSTFLFLSLNSDRKIVCVLVWKRLFIRNVKWCVWNICLHRFPLALRVECGKQ